MREDDEARCARPPRSAEEVAAAAAAAAGVVVRPMFFNARGGRERNPMRVPLAAFLREQTTELARFRAAAAKRAWGRIHASHFDW